MAGEDCGRELLLRKGFADRIFHAANRIQDGTGSPLCLAIGLEFRIADELAGGLLHTTEKLIGGTFDAIFVHMERSLMRKLQRLHAEE
jgi:hypothetical protein